jgi:phosphatidylinositol alpha-1,6-mannosyltransferase
VRVFQETRRIVKQHGIDVICIGELSSGSWIGLLGQRLLGCKMVNYIHGEEITTETGYRFFGRHRRRYLRRADAVIAVSHFTERALQRLMGVDPAKIHLIHNGVDTGRFTPGPKSPSIIARHGLEGKQVILTVGRIVPRKGIDTVIRALPAILDAAPNAHYVVVGSGDYSNQLRDLVARLDLADHVTFAGKVGEKELVDYYRTCDLFAMPNRDMPDGDTEGFGLVFLEANACGRPVVGGRAGGAVEAVRDGENGLLADGWSVADVGAKISLLLTDDALHQAIAERGLAIAAGSSSRSKARHFHRICRELVTQ